MLDQYEPAFSVHPSTLLQRQFSSFGDSACVWRVSSYCADCGRNAQKPIVHRTTHICTARHKGNDAISSSGRTVALRSEMRQQWVWKGSEKERSWPNLGLILASVFKNWGEPQKILKIIFVTAEVLTKNLHNNPSREKLRPACFVSFVCVHSPWIYVPFVPGFHLMSWYLAVNYRLIYLYKIVSIFTIVHH